MRSNDQPNAITQVVSETLAKDFDNIRIIHVRILEPDEFMDDADDFLRIEVVFEADAKHQPVFSKVVRHVRPKLNEIGVTAFPIFSFTTQSDQDGKAA